MAERLARKAYLDKRSAVIEPQLVPLTAKARVTIEQLKAIRETIRGRTRRIAQLLDSFLERSTPSST